MEDWGSLKLGFQGNEAEMPAALLLLLPSTRDVVTEENAVEYDEASISSAIKWLESSPPKPVCLFISLIPPPSPPIHHFQYPAITSYSMYRPLDLPARVKVAKKTGYKQNFIAAICREHELEATGALWQEAKAVYVSTKREAMCTEGHW